MNKFKSVLLCILLIISCCLPANSYANGIDIINKILNTQQNEVNGMDLINKALNGNDYQEVKMIYSKQELAQEIKKVDKKDGEKNTIDLIEDDLVFITNR